MEQQGRDIFCREVNCLRGEAVSYDCGRPFGFQPSDSGDFPFDILSQSEWNWQMNVNMMTSERRILRPAKDRRRAILGRPTSIDADKVCPVPSKKIGEVNRFERCYSVARWMISPTMRHFS